MGNNVNINIKIADLQGEYKNLAKAANANGNDSIDTAYEHSLFTQYCQDANLDSGDYDAAYVAKDTVKAEKDLVKSQGYKGGTKTNMAELDQIEANYQGTLRTAFKFVGNNPELRMKLMDAIKDKPKMKNFSDMADYKAAMGQHIESIANIAQIDLAEHIDANHAELKAGQAKISGQINSLDDLVNRRFDTVEEKIDAVAGFVLQDLMVDLENLGISKQNLEISKKNLQLNQRILRYSQAILKNTNDIKAGIAQIKQLVMFDISLDIENLRVGHQNLAVALDTNDKVYENGNKLDNLTDEVVQSRQEILERIDSAEQNLTKEVRDCADPLGVNRGIAKVRDAVKNAARKAGQSVAEFLRNNPTASFFGCDASLISRAKLFD